VRKVRQRRQQRLQGQPQRAAAAQQHEQGATGIMQSAHVDTRQLTQGRARTIHQRCRCLPLLCT
jgi:hypothetical protein